MGGGYGFTEGGRFLFKCRFLLENLTDSAQEFQVGFPLKADRVRHANIANKTDGDRIPDFEKFYRFQTSDANGKYDVEYHKFDKTGRYEAVFTWSMSMESHETLMLYVEYSMPISFTWYSARIDYWEVYQIGSSFKVDIERSLFVRDSVYDKAWHETVEGCYLTHVKYVTSTAKSWEGPLETANFTVHFGEYLEIIDSSFGGQLKMGELVSTSECVQFIPDGFVDEDTVVTWEFDSHSLPDEIVVNFFNLFIPGTLSELELAIGALGGRNEFGTKEDYRDLREIVAAFYGIEPQREYIKRFVEKQVWVKNVVSREKWELDDDVAKMLKYLDEKAD